MWIMLNLLKYILVEYECFFLICNGLLLILLCELIVGLINLDTFFSWASGSESEWFKTPLERLRVMAVFFVYLELFLGIAIWLFLPETVTKFSIEHSKIPVQIQRNNENIFQFSDYKHVKVFTEIISSVQS